MSSQEGGQAVTERKDEGQIQIFFSYVLWLIDTFHPKNIKTLELKNIFGDPGSDS